MCTISSGQNRRGYDLDPQLKILSNFNPPVSKAIAPVASVFMDLMPKKIDKENIIYESLPVLHSRRRVHLQGRHNPGVTAAKDQVPVGVIFNQSLNPDLSKQAKHS